MTVDSCVSLCRNLINDIWTVPNTVYTTTILDHMIYGLLYYYGFVCHNWYDCCIYGILA